MVNLLQKDRKEKRKTNPHSGTFGCPTHERPLRSQKSLHFAYAPKPTHHPWKLVDKIKGKQKDKRLKNVFLNFKEFW